MLNERHSGDLFEAEEQRREARRNEEENKGKKKIKWYSNRETENYVQSTKRAQWEELVATDSNPTTS